MCTFFNTVSIEKPFDRETINIAISSRMINFVEEVALSIRYFTANIGTCIIVVSYLRQCAIIHRQNSILQLLYISPGNVGIHLINGYIIARSIIILFKATK